MESRKICVVGLGKLGACFAAVLAHAGHRVIGVDRNPDTVFNLTYNLRNSEPQLNDLVAETRDKTLQVTTNLNYAVSHSDISFVIVPTNSLEDGSFDASEVFNAVTHIRDAISGPHVCSVVSTVSPGTMGKLKHLCDDDFALVYSPLLIALGSVVDDLRNPDLMIIGHDSPSAAAEVISVLRDVVGDKVPHPHLSFEEAEITKLGINAYIVMKIAYANMLASAAPQMGANAKNVLHAIGTDKRIGNKYFSPGGPGGQGPCFARDEAALCAWLEGTKGSTRIPIAVQQTERHQLLCVLDFFRSYKRITILGTSYKAGTPVKDNSFGFLVAKHLSQLGKIVYLHDPSDSSTAPQTLINRGEAVLVAVPWSHYADIDLKDKPSLDLWGISKASHVWGRNWPI
jgi:UDPglucose 6-dehydrogenase